jgi:hypothetical protein
MNKQSKTDWAKIKAMKDRDIDFSDAPELGDDFFTEATLWPGKKKQITIWISSKQRAGAIRAASMPPFAAIWRRSNAA